MVFNPYGKKGKPSHTKPLQDLTVTIPTAQLLEQNKRADLVAKIQDAIELEPARFESLCLTLLQHVANHCQSLPATDNSYYALPGGQLDYVLNRAEAALHLLRHHILQEEGEDFSEEQKLWMYALFSAAILQGIGKLKTDYLVTLYDNNGHELKLWDPLLESLVAHGKYYDYQLQADLGDDLRNRLTLLLARQLLPVSGFVWITSNFEVLAAWLALLQEDWQSAGVLAAILMRAEAIAVQRYYNELMLAYGVDRAGGGYRIGTFTDPAQTSLQEKEQITGIQFLQWLNKALESGKLMINRAPLLAVPAGIVMSADVYKLFIRENPEYKNWQAVQHGFQALGLHQRKAGAANATLGVSGADTGSVFANYALLLPETVQVANVRTGKVVTMSALECTHRAQLTSNFTEEMQIDKLPHLTAAGKWQQLSTEPVTMRAGNMFRG